MEDYYVRLATPTDTPSITTLHASVFTHLQTQNRLQELAPISDDYLSTAILAQRCFVLVSFCSSPSSSPSTSPTIQPDKARNETVIGRAFLKSLPSIEELYPRIGEVENVKRTLERRLEMGERGWGVVHSVMVEPGVQGRGLGAVLMRGVVDLVRIEGEEHREERGRGKRSEEGKQVRGGIGTLILDCWAGNQKLRRFYGGLEGWDYVGDVPEETWEVAVFCCEVR